MKVLLITQYYYPEVGAPQMRLRGLVRCLTEAGHEIHVLTGFPNYPTGIVPEGYRGKLFMRERIDGVPVTRIWIMAAPNVGFARRILSHLSFALTCLLGAIFVGPADIVVAESPPLFVGASGAIVAKGKRAGLLLSVADLWPEMAVALGALTNPLVIRAAEALESAVYRASDHIVVPWAGIKEYISGRKGIPRDRITHAPNAVDLERFAGVAVSPLAESLAPHGRFAVMYCGTISPSHALQTVVEAASLLRDLSEVIFVLAGDGPDRVPLEQHVQQLNLKNVVFAGAVAAEDVPGLLARADVCLNVYAKAEIFEDVMPRKTGEYLASGKPLLMSTSRSQVEQNDAGMWVPPEDADALAQAIRVLHANPELRSRYGLSARRWAAKEFSLTSVCARYLEAVGAAKKR